jgi:hypothetical protein
LEYILKHNSLQEKVKSPPTWVQQKLSVELFPVSPNDIEWTKVENRVRQTIPTAKIIALQRIQHLPLWERYCMLQGLLRKKLPSNQIELELFHGTKTNCM